METVGTQATDDFAHNLTVKLAELTLGGGESVTLKQVHDVAFAYFLVHSKLWKDDASINASYETCGTLAAVALARKFIKGEIVSEKQVREALGDYRHEKSAQFMPIKDAKFGNTDPKDKQVTCIDIKPEEVSNLRNAGWNIFLITLEALDTKRNYNMLPLTGIWNKGKIDDDVWYDDHETLVEKKGFENMNKFVKREGLVEPSHCIELWFKGGVLVKMHQKQPQVLGKLHPDLREFGFHGWGDTFTVSTAANISTEVGKIGFSDGQFILLPFNPFTKSAIISKEDFTKKYPGEGMEALIKATFASAHFQMPLVHSKLWKDEASINASYATGGTQAAVALARKFIDEDIEEEIMAEQIVHEALGDCQREKSAQFMPIKHATFGNTGPEDTQVTCIAIKPEEVSNLRNVGWKIFSMYLNPCEDSENRREYNMLPVTGSWNKGKIDDEAWYADHETFVEEKGFEKMNKFVKREGLVEPSHCIKFWFKGGVLVKIQQKQPQLRGKANPDIIDGGPQSQCTVSTATNISTEVGKIGTSDGGKFVLLPFNPHSRSTITAADFMIKYGVDMEEFNKLIHDEFQSALW